MAHRFFGDPATNAAALVGEIEEAVAHGGVHPTAATRLVNLGTLELYRTWRWSAALAICSGYRDVLLGKGLGDPEDVGSVTLNIVRLHAAVGDLAGAVGWLSHLVPHRAAHPSICRELMNAALLCESDDAPSIIREFGLQGHEADLVRLHTTVASTGRSGGRPAVGTGNLAELWGLEVALLAALHERDLDCVMQYTLTATTAAADGTAGAGALMAIERAASTFDRRRTFADDSDDRLLHVASGLVSTADELGIQSLRLKGQSLALRAGGAVQEPGRLLQDASRASLPRELARTALALESHGPADVAGEARRLLSSLALTPCPVELNKVPLASTGGWDGLNDQTRTVVNLLAVRLGELVGSVG